MLVHHIKTFIQKHRLIQTGDRILAAVSGGPDSVALLHILQRLHYEIGFHILVGHFNHRLRPEAQADQRFVQTLAEKWHIPCHTAAWTKTQQHARKGSLEDRAREARYHFLTALVKKYNAHAVALAHNQDDAAETVLMHLLRGAGMQGLRGILPQQTLYQTRIIRPLLNTPRSAIETYLKKYRIKFRIDATNLQPIFFRNKIRLELLPYLEKNYNPSIKSLLHHLGENLATDYDFLYNQARQALKRIGTAKPAAYTIQLSLSKLIGLHPALQRMAVRLSIENIVGHTKRLTLVHYHEIEQLIYERPGGSIVHLPGDLEIHKSPSDIVIRVKKTST